MSTLSYFRVGAALLIGALVLASVAGTYFSRARPRDITETHQGEARP